MAKVQSHANRERKVQDTKNAIGRTARGVKNLILGAGSATLTAVALYNAAKITGADKVIGRYGKQAFGTAMRYGQQAASKVGDILRRVRR